MRRKLFLLVVLATLSRPLFSQDGALQIASLGDFSLGSGETIHNLQIGYRILGKLNEDRSNAVLFPTWFTGTSQQLLGMVGPDGLVNSQNHFIILVEAIGNGVSSSPSNSAAQPGMKFPHFTIRDMVRSQYRLLTETLDLDRLHAVIGISMGGMQAFQWAVSYPEFASRVIPIVGSPRLASYDRILWRAGIRAIQRDPEWQQGRYTAPPRNAMKTVGAITALALTTPEYRNRETDPEGVDEFLEENARGAVAFDANDWIRQAQAMLGHDIFEPFGGSQERAAEAVQAEVLVVVDLNDHMVTPGPALEFARYLLAPTLVLDSPCGHLAPGCEMESVKGAVRRMLEK